MSELTIDDAVAAVLGATRGEVVLRDRTGKEIGRFRSTLDQAAMHAKYGHLWTEEDLARAEAVEKDFRENGGFTTAEVLTYLRGLDSK